MNAAEKLRLMPENIKYNELLVKFRKLSKSKQFNYACTKNDLDSFTIIKLQDNGFRIDATETNGYQTFLISW